METEQYHKKDLPRFGIRHLQVVMLFLLNAIAIGMRVHFSVSVVAMTDPTASSNPDVPVYNWHNKSVILSSFYWGYIGLQLFAAELGRRYGCKPFLLGAMTVASTFFAITPWLADQFGSYGVMGSRAIQGMCQGFVFPSVSNLLGRWTHISERSKLGSFIVSGSPFGIVLTMPIVGYISASSLGWPFSFYLYAGLGYLWVLAFLIFGASTPADSKTISKEEKEYIESSTKIKTKTKKMTIPFISILECIPFWALFFVQVGQAWGCNTLLTEIPNYMNKVMEFDMKSNGILSTIPYLVNFIFSFLFGLLCDYLINNEYLTRTTARKVFNGISGIGAGISLLILSVLPVEARNLEVLMLISAVGIQSASTGGYVVNHIDLSPNFAGVLQAICNTAGSSLTILAPLTVQFLVNDESNKSEWQLVFIIAGLMFTIPSIVFCLFASAERQKWDGVDNDDIVARNISETKGSRY